MVLWDNKTLNSENTYIGSQVSAFMSINITFANIYSILCINLNVLVMLKNEWFYPRK